MSFGLGSAAFPAFSPTIDGKLRPFLKSADPSDAIATPFKILRVCGKPSSAQCAMGNSVTRVVGCFVPGAYDHGKLGALVPNPALDEGLGHSFCYVRPSSDAVNLSPSHSDRYSSELHSSSFRSHRTASDSVVFKTISGASVSANTSTPHTIISHEQLHSFTNVPDDRHAAFESSGSFVSIPLQPVPRGVTFSGPISSTFSGPMPASLERVFRSGPLELSHMSGPMDGIQLDQTHFSAPLAGPYNSKRSRGRRHLSRLFNSFGRPAKGLLSKTISSTLARTHRSLVVPVRQFVRQRVRTGGKDAGVMYDSGSELRYPLSDADPTDSNNLQWAQGKAGEDRVHVVVSEDHGWLFVGIYDGFNGPDAPDFLMRNLYTAVYRELQGLLWDAHRCSEQDVVHSNPNEDAHFLNKRPENGGSVTHMAKDVPSGQDHHVCSTHGRFMRSRTLREYLDDTDSDDDSFGSQNANSLSSSFSMPLTSKEVSSCCRKHANREHNQAVSLAQASSNVSEGNVEDGPGNEERDFEDNRRGSNMNCHAMITSPSGLTGKGIPQPSFGSKQMKKKESHRKFLPQRENLSCNCSKSDGEKSVKGGTNLQRERAIDHGGVLAALSQALLETEEAYFNMADLAMGDNPELLLMGSCILVALVKDKDVYILNVGDSRAIVAQEADRSCPSYPCSSERAIGGNGLKDAVVQNDLESILEDSPAATEMVRGQMEMGAPPSSTSLLALQLSQDHSTSIEEEVQRLQLEHPDDNMCIFNDRVKGRLKVTRAFGAGFLKKPRWNNAVLKMFQIDYVGSDPYVTCTPALRHHRLGSNDRFLVLSSDGLYQYFSNDEVVSHVEWFMQKFPEGDPAQHLIEELLFRAAKKAGMDFHELLDIPQGDRRKYHDDVSVMVISLEGKVWKSSS